MYLCRHTAKVAQLAEHDLPKVGVAGSSPVFRSRRYIFIFVILLIKKNIIKTGIFSVVEFMQQIRNSDIEGFMTSLQAYFAAIPYTADNRNLVKIGVAFSQQERGIKRWLIE